MKIKEVENGVAVQDPKFDYPPEQSKLINLPDDDALETVQPDSGEAKNVVADQPKKLQTRLSDPYKPLLGRQQDRNFPAADKLSYDNYLVAVNEIPGEA